MIGQVMPGRVKYFFNQQWLKHDIFSKLLQYNFTFFGKEVIMLKDPRLKVLLIGCKQGLCIKECFKCSMCCSCSHQLKEITCDVSFKHLLFFLIKLICFTDFNVISIVSRSA